MLAQGSAMQVQPIWRTEAMSSSTVRSWKRLTQPPTARLPSPTSSGAGVPCTAAKAAAEAESGSGRPISISGLAMTKRTASAAKPRRPEIAALISPADAKSRFSAT